MWSVLAWAAVALHVLYLLYQTFGALFGLYDWRWVIPHLGCVVWGVGIVVIQGNCPVTKLEKYFIAEGGGTAYGGSFLDHYLFGRLLPEGTQELVYGLHLVIIIVTYVVVVRHWRRVGRPGARTDTDAKAPEQGTVITSAPTQ
jgi:hypothetical protein